MVDERDLISAGRKTRVSEPTAGFVQWLADGKLQPIAAAEVTHYGQAVSVGRPIGPLHLLQQLARRASYQRRSSQCAHADPGSEGLAVQQHRHLRCGRDRHKLSVAQSHRPRVGSLGARREYIKRTTLPCGAVENGLSIRCEAGRPYAASPECKLTVERRLGRRSSKKQFAYEQTGSQGHEGAETGNDCDWKTLAGRRLNCFCRRTRRLLGSFHYDGSARRIERALQALQVCPHLRRSLAA